MDVPVGGSEGRRKETARPGGSLSVKPGFGLVVGGSDGPAAGISSISRTSVAVGMMDAGTAKMDDGRLRRRIYRNDIVCAAS